MIIEQAYAAFNERDIDSAFALMTPDVSWPRASEGGKVIGKEEIRAYLALVNGVRPIPTSNRAQ